MESLLLRGSRCRESRSSSISRHRRHRSSYGNPEYHRHAIAASRGVRRVVSLLVSGSLGACRSQVSRVSGCYVVSVLWSSGMVPRISVFFVFRCSIMFTSMTITSMMLVASSSSSYVSLRSNSTHDWNSLGISLLALVTELFSVSSWHFNSSCYCLC